MHCEVVNVTPELAAHYLNNNPNNRPITKVRVRSFAAMMDAGQWLVNGETIVISATGRLLDGQHRLAAVIEYGKPVPMLVAQGADDASFATIDIGAKRSGGNILQMANVPNASQTAGGAGILYKVFHLDSFHATVPAPYILEIIRRYPQFSEWSPKARACGKIFPPSALIAACVYLDAIAQAPELADQLVAGLRTGENLSRGDPILALRNRVVNIKSGNYASNASRVVWEPLVRTIDALEADTPLQVARGSESSKALRPQRFRLHERRLTAEQRLVDLPPQARRAGA